MFTHKKSLLSILAMLAFICMSFFAVTQVVLAEGDEEPTEEVGEEEESAPTITISMEEFAAVGPTNGARYHGVSAGFLLVATEETPVTEIRVTLERQNGGSIVKTSGPAVLAKIPSEGSVKFTTPFVIQEGEFIEAEDTNDDGDLYWNPAPATWDVNTIPTKVTVEVIGEGGVVLATGVNSQFTESGLPYTDLLTSAVPGYNGTWFVSADSVDGDGSEQYPFSTISEAVAAAGIGETVKLLSDITTAAQITISKSINIDGNGHKIVTAFTNGIFNEGTGKYTNTNPRNNSAIGVLTDEQEDALKLLNVTIKNLVIDGEPNQNLHGINIYRVASVAISDVTIKNKNAAVNVNASEVSINNISTVNSSWGGINVDKGTEIMKAELTIGGSNSHADIEGKPAIWIDHPEIPYNTVIDSDGQYRSSIAENGHKIFVLGTTPVVVEEQTVYVADNVEVTLPEDVIITPAGTWDGVIEAPQVVETTVTPDAPRGYVATPVVSIKVGADVALTFDKAVKLVFAGHAGKKVGWSRGSDFTPITDTCPDDKNDLAPGADCVEDEGEDLVVWTKHFTTFTVYTETAKPRSSSSGSSSRRTTATLQTPTAAPTVSAVVTTATFSRDLGVGATGDDVTALQNRLVAEGVYTGPVTGYFGTLTEEAVKQYQTKMGLPSTGFVGPITRAELQKGTPAATVTVTTEAEIASLRLKLQALLQELVVALQKQIQAQ